MHYTSLSNMTNSTSVQHTVDVAVLPLTAAGGVLAAAAVLLLGLLSVLLELSLHRLFHFNWCQAAR
jgi:hypothetical protein